MPNWLQNVIVVAALLCMIALIYVIGDLIADILVYHL